MKIFYYFVPKLETLLVEGPDALDFLHRLTTLNFKTLKSGEIKEGLLLTPQGKISGHFFCAAESKSRFFLGSSFGSSSLHKALDMMLFREQVTIREVSREYEFFRIVSNEEILNLKSFFLAQAELPNLVVEPIKYDLMAFLKTESLPQLKKELQTQGFQNGSNELYEGLRVRSGCVEFPNELNAEMNPLELGLDPIISENKGFYP